MTDTERLRAAVEHYRKLDGYMDSREPAALADLFDGIAERHTMADDLPEWCDWCRLQAWPCPDVRAALAVADALGIEAAS